MEKRYQVKIHTVQVFILVARLFSSGNYLSMEAQLGQVAFLGVDLKVKMKAGNANSCSQCNQNSRMNHDSVISTSTLEI